MASVLVVGDVMLDVTVHGQAVKQCNECPQVSVVLADDFEFNLGGAGNVAEIMALEGHQVTLAGAIAADWAGIVVRSLCDLLSIKPILKPILPVTSTKLRIWDGNRYVVRSDVERRIDVPPVYWNLGRYDAVVLSDYCRGVFHQGWAEVLAPFVGENSNPPIVVDCKPDSPLPVYRGTSVVTPNLPEAKEMGELLGISYNSNEELCGLLREAIGVPCMTITMGEEGVMVGTEHEITHIPAGSVSNPQTIGAGDAFAAAMAVSLGEGSDYREAAEYACAAATEYVARVREPVLGSNLTLTGWLDIND